MAFSPITFRNESDPLGPPADPVASATPINKIALEAIQTHVADYADSLVAGLASAGVVDTVTNQLLVTPSANTYNGVVVKGRTGWDGTQPYGQAQGYMLLRDDNSAGANLYGTVNAAPDRDVIFRVDGRTGGLGTSGGAHFALGLRQHAGFTATQNVWIQNFYDAHALVIAHAVVDSANYYILAEDSSSNLGFVVAHGQAGLYSRLTNQLPALSLGRGSLNNEGQLSIANLTDNPITGAAAGDVILRQFDAAKAIKLGIGTAQALKLDASGADITGFVKGTRGGSSSLVGRSGAAASLTYLDLGRTALDLTLGVAGAANDLTSGTAQADAVLRQANVGGQLWIGVGTDAQEIRIQDAKLGFFNTAPVSKPSAYTTTNVTTDRSYDANATSIDEIADVLGTLIADFKSLGLVG